MFLQPQTSMTNPPKVLTYIDDARTVWFTEYISVSDDDYAWRLLPAWLMLEYFDNEFYIKNMPSE